MSAAVNSRNRGFAPGSETDSRAPLGSENSENPKFRFAAPGEATRKIHEDTSIPSSRGCPLDYHFADIVTFYPGDDRELIVAVLILLEKRGFEGPDGRYLAVTTRLAL